MSTRKYYKTENKYRSDLIDFWVISLELYDLDEEKRLFSNISLIDDIEFQKKCIDRLVEYMNKNQLGPEIIEYMKSRQTQLTRKCCNIISSN